MQKNSLAQAIQKLSEDFLKIKWKYIRKGGENVQLWPGRRNEEIVICVYKGKKLLENFHRQDYFFFNFAYKGCYSAFSRKQKNRVVISEGECYIGQPFTGYGISDESPSDVTIIGVLIQKEAFFKTYFHTLSSDKKMFEFFLTPQKNSYSDEFIKLKFDEDFYVRHLLELMVTQYNNQDENTQKILQPLTLALLMLVAREYKKQSPDHKDLSLAEQIEFHIGEHYHNTSLAQISKHFGYHPNYISALLTKELGKSFSKILLEQRMERAAMLLKDTDLSIAEIAEMLGYTNTSNFHKAFKNFYGNSPRDHS